MPIPKYNQIQVPALQLLADGRVLKNREFEEPLAKVFSLTDEEINETYPSMAGDRVFADRISWALSYLFMTELVERPQRGYYTISQKGKELLQTPDQITNYIDKTVKEIAKKKKAETTLVEVIENKPTALTPQESLYESFTAIRETIYEEIITTILRKSPEAFEKLVVMLLQKMGYGGEIKDSGLVTKRSNDGGIDGVIKEDVLGFGRINIQAKRYKRDSVIGREEIQKFVGALMVAQSNKGVFITTSYFSKGAIEYVKSLFGNTTVVLIDGMQLAEYIYNYSLGMQIEQVIEIKKMDTDFWDSMSDYE